VHEERVESLDLCLRLKSAASSFSPLDITANAIRPILSTLICFGDDCCDKTLTTATFPGFLGRREKNRNVSF
jgi:hypothetical protein